MSQPIIAKLYGTYADKRDAIAAVCEGLNAPAWVSYNLDALYDFLTGEVPGPAEVHWQDCGGPDEVIAVLTDAAQAREDLNIRITR